MTHHQRKEYAMSARFNIVLSDDLNKALDQVVDESETSKSDVLRKALTLYLAAREGSRKGLKLGLAEKSEDLKTEIVGL
jgi:predicted transcriptional regulator